MASPFGLLAPWEDDEEQRRRFGGGLLAQPSSPASPAGLLAMPHFSGPGASWQPSMSNPSDAFAPSRLPLSTPRSHGDTNPPVAQASQADLAADRAANAGPAPMPGDPMQLGSAAPLQQQQAKPGFFSTLGNLASSIYGQGGPGDGMINLGLAVASPGNMAVNVQKAMQMQAVNQLARQRQAQEQLKFGQQQAGLAGNLEVLKRAYPGYSDQQLMGLASNPTAVQEAMKRVNPNETFRVETDGQGRQWQINTQNGQRSLLVEGNYQTVTDPAQRAQFGVPADYKGPVQVGADGKLVMPGKAATEVNISQQSEKALDVERSKGLATRMNSIAEDSAKASEDGVFLGRMGDLLGVVQTGKQTEVLEKVRELTGLTLDPNTDNVQALKAAVNYLAPRLRVPGSGAQSDRELNNFIQSIPSLAGTPGGNKLILDTLGGIIEHRKQRADVALQWQVGDISAKEAQERINALPSPFVNLPKPAAPVAPGATPRREQDPQQQPFARPTWRRIQ